MTDDKNDKAGSTPPPGRLPLPKSLMGAARSGAAAVRDPSQPQPPIDTAKDTFDAYKKMLEYERIRREEQQKNLLRLEAERDEAIRRRLAPAPEVPPAGGSLRGNVRILLQTRMAQDLIAGRADSIDRAKQIVGLMTFAKSSRQVHEAARLEDPYAHWYLLRMTKEIEAGKQNIAALQTALTDRMQQMPGVEIDVGATQKAFSLPLTFSTAHAFQAAYLLVQYDNYIRMVLTACHCGMLSGRHEQFLLINEAGKVMRRVFAVASDYVYIKGLTVDSIRGNDTDAAKVARKRMGQIPEDVLSGKERDPYAPSRRTLMSPEVADATRNSLSGAFKSRIQRMQQSTGSTVGADDPV